jgi:aryl-alcohol dehydrogenase-like predicted oxidoreductase
MKGKPWIVPIPGTRRLENLGALDLDVELTPEDLREIDEAILTIPVSGQRLPEEHMAMIDR